MRIGTIVLALSLLAATIMPGKLSAQRGPNMTPPGTDASQPLRVAYAQKASSQPSAQETLDWTNEF